MANFITILRLVLSFVVAAMLFVPAKCFYITALVLTVLVIWMDGLDGYVARKFNECSKLGAVLDIMSDRVVENVYWITFAVLGWIGIWVPLVVVARGIITDSLRSVALESGYTAFGSSTMMESKIGRFIVASNFCRFTYALVKALGFVLLIAGCIPVEYRGKAGVLLAGYICAYTAVAFCVVRAIPVIIESKRFFVKNDK